MIERCGGFSLLLCYLNILMRPAQATNTAIKIIAVVILRACSSVAVTVTVPIKLLLVLISSILQIKGFSGVFNHKINSIQNGNRLHQRHSNANLNQTIQDRKIGTQNEVHQNQSLQRLRVERFA